MEDRSKMPRQSQSWHSMSTQAVYDTLDTAEDGLGDAEASERLGRYGCNELAAVKNRSVAEMLAEQLKDPMVLILAAAAAVSAGLGEWTEAGVILIIVAVNAVVSITQEKKAQSSLDALKSLTAPNAIVMRQGEESVIPAREIVPGDVVMLETGAMVPADIRLIHSSNMQIEQASLTGESLPSDKDSDDIHPEKTAPADRTNMAFSSSFVTYGRGMGVAVATGMDTQVGSVARLLDREDNTQTPLKQKLDAVGKILTIAGLGVCAVIFALGYLTGRPLVPLLMTAISLAISVIPEGLPATATIVLALGVRRMAKKGAIIRKLPAVETLGGATVICSDKTGTLTLNKMTVTEIAANGDFKDAKSLPIEQAVGQNNHYYEIIRAGALCNNAEYDPDRPGEILGDPTEGALLNLSERFGENHDDMETLFPRLFEQPFDSDRKKMTTVHMVNSEIIAYTKGAVDELLPLCTRILSADRVRDITEDDRAQIMLTANNMAEDALRVLAFAKKTLTQIPEDEDEDVEYDLTFIGVVGMIDPPREEVKDAIERCRKAGIRTVMITGDHQITARKIAESLNIYRPGDMILTGDDLEEMSQDMLDAAVGKTTIYARVTPEQKLDIVKALGRTGETVCMTGDGVNDAPALKAADIGCAMGITGTDVAKEAADMVITDDNFTTIVTAVEEGRRVYRNIQKVIQFLLSGNISEILTIFIATLMGLEAPLLAVHILWINLATDTLPALALGIDPAEKDVMSRKPLKSDSLFEKSLISNVLIHGFFISAVTLTAFVIGLNIDNLTSGQTMAFCTIAFAQLFYSNCMRSSVESMFSKDFFNNPTLLGATGVSVVLLLALMFVPPLRAAFNFDVLTGAEWLICIGLGTIPALLVELMKLFKRTRRKTAAV